MLTFLKKIFVWWNQETLGTKLNTFFFGKFVGKDEFGNNKAMLIYKKTNLVRKTARVMFEKIGELLIEKNLGRDGP